MAPPLINEYKKTFVQKRFLQTFLGGLRLTHGCVPLFVYSHQLCIFVFPALLGVLFTILIQSQILSLVISIVLYAVLLTVFSIGIQLLSRWLQNRTSNKVQNKTDYETAATPTPLSLLSEDDEIDFSAGCFSSRVWQYLIPPKHFAVNMFLHAIIAGVVGSFAWKFLLPSETALTYKNSGMATLWTVVAWFVVCNGLYSLTAAPTPEPATFQPLDQWEISSLSRPAHLSLCLITQWILRSVNPSSTWIGCADRVLHALFILLPVLWVFGVLPPIDALLLWAGEQILCFVFGGAPCASLLALITSLVLAPTCIAFLWTFTDAQPYQLLVGIGLFAYILSTDIGSIVKYLIFYILKISPKNYFRMTTRKQLWAEIGLHCLQFIVSGITIFSIANNRDVKTIIEITLPGNVTVSSDNIVDPLSNTTRLDLLMNMCIGLLLFVIISSEIQKVYIVFGIFRNHLHSSFQNGRLGWMFQCLRSAMVYRGIPLFLMCFSCECALDDKGFFAILRGPNTFYSLIVLTSLFRLMRWSWQCPELALLDINLLWLVEGCFGLQVNQQEHPYMCISVRLSIISFIRDRLCELINKVYFILTLIATSVTHDAQKKASLLVVSINLFFLPILLTILALTVILSAPLLPIFTLPLFIMGFSRPCKFWHYGSKGGSPSPDTIYYEQMAPRLLVAFHEAVECGSLGLVIPGSQYLMHYSDRLIWISVLERGNGYTHYTIKGLELQETSCHSVEASCVNDVFACAFGAGESNHISTKTMDSVINPSWYHTLTPLTCISVQCYSDARSVLTGVIDSPDYSKCIPLMFKKCLIWILLNGLLEGKFQNKEAETVTSRGDANTHDDPDSVVTDIRNCNTVVAFDDEDVWEEQKIKGYQPPPRQLSLPDSLSSWSEEDHLTHKRPRHLPPLPTTSAKFNDIPLPSAVYQDSISSPKPVSKQLVPSVFNVKPVVTPAQIKQFQLPEKWLSKFDKRPRTNDGFPADWFQLLVVRAKKLQMQNRMKEDRLSMNGKKNKKTSRYEEEVIIERDESSTWAERESKTVTQQDWEDVVMGCSDILALNISDANHTPALIHRIFSGKIPWSTSLDWLLNEDALELKEIIIEAYRYCVSVCLDQLLLSEGETDEELIHMLEVMDSDWYIGNDTNAAWGENVIKETPTMFSLGTSTTDELLMLRFTSHRLTLKNANVRVGRLNSEVVRGLWASLAMELLYLTNDDEERYSIQAHRTLLRNLTIQAADPPLGYHIYSSGSCRIASSDLFSFSQDNAL